MRARSRDRLWTGSAVRVAHASRKPRQGDAWGHGGHKSPPGLHSQAGIPAAHAFPGSRAPLRRRFLCCTWVMAVVGAGGLARSERAIAQGPSDQSRSDHEQPAQRSAPPQDGQEQPAEVIVVTGSRREERARDAVVATEVIGRHAIEQSGTRNVGELLQERAGLQLRRSYRGSALLLRGLGSEYTLVLVNGDRVPGRIGGAIDLSRYGVENVERVEIVRGPSSALYGADALGGVINIITRRPHAGLEGDALLSVGQNGSLDLTSRVGGRPARRVDFQLTAGLHRAGAFRSGAVEATRGSARRQWSAGLRVGLHAGTSHELRAQADYVQLELRGIDEGAGSAVFDRTQLQEQLVASVEQRLGVSDAALLVSRVSYNEFREQYLLDQRQGSALDKDEDNRERLAQATQLLHLRASGVHELSFGLEGLSQQLDSPRIDSRGRRVRLSVFGQDEWQVLVQGQTRLRVVPGLRLDADSQFGRQLSPKLALRLDAGPALVLRAMYGRGFRAPSFKELLLRFENPTAGYAVSGNPDLRAERSHGVDLGVAWRPHDVLDLRTSLFRNDLDGMIAVVMLDTSATGRRFSYQNLRSAWTMGVESAAELRPGGVFALSLAHTLTQTWDADKHRRLEGRPLHRLTAAPRFRCSDWGSDASVRVALLLGRVFYEDENNDGVEEQLRAPVLAQVDLRLAKHFGREFELAFGIDNLLDAGDRYSVLRPRTAYGAVRGRY
ncbi:MAG: TonB-dependent receptor [Proteobacteria bacterium]|nr:TonB-dependent receptor [Pseudomonadota bacterium]